MGIWYANTPTPYFLKDDWSINKPITTTSPNKFNFDMLKDMGTLPMTTYLVIHYLFFIGDQKEEITLHQDRPVEKISMCCDIYTYDQLDKKNRPVKQQWA